MSNRNGKPMREPAKLTTEDVIAELRSNQGDRTLRAYAGELGIHETYLSFVLKGRQEPGPKILRQLGLRKVRDISVSYVREQTKEISRVGK